MSLGDWVGRKYARLATNAVVRRPGLWRVFRGPLRRQFDALASRWEAIRSANPGALEALGVALERLDEPPRRALDLGTGTGAAAAVLARRFPGVEVVGVDLAPAMVAEARRTLPGELAGRVRFELADASRLPYADGSFDLVVLANMIPFFDELARVVGPGGAALFSFSAGRETPIYVPAETIRRELDGRGFASFDEIDAGRATALLARKPPGA